MKTATVATFAALAALTTTSPAQTPACLSANDANNVATSGITGYGFAGENWHAWQITPANAFVIQSARVFTANVTLSGDRYMSIEIWDDVGGLPGTRLAGGSWKIVGSRPHSWQGANLDQFGILQQGVPVWLVWVEPGWSEWMTEPGGNTSLPLATRTGSGAWGTSTATPTSAPKFRLFCNQLDDANSVPFGAGCALSTGQFPTTYTNEQPMLGNSGFFFESSGNPPGGAVFLAFGLDPTWMSAPIPLFPAGCLQNTDLLTAVLLFAGTGNTRGPTFSGYAQFAFPIPSNPGFTGITIAAQAAPYDAGATAPLQFATSNAHRITLF